MSTSHQDPHRRLTVAQARADLVSIVHEVERPGPVELTEDGKPVAVIVALDEYRRLAGTQADTWAAYEQFRAMADPADLLDDDGTFAGLRDRSPGRDIAL